jgi:GAF domain-containing protein
MTQEHLVGVIREFTGTIINPFDRDELMHRLMKHATSVVNASGAGVMLADESGELGFVAASQERLVEVEQHQAHLERGACFEAYATNRIIQVEDLRTEERWPAYARRAVDLGLLSVLGVPMNALGQTIGVINFYRGEASTWSEEDVNAAEIITAMGAGYILNADQMRAQHLLGDQLRTAIASRDVIGQAKGILMARANVDADAAFEMLRQRSQDRNRKLRDLAQQIVQDHEARAGTR